MSSNNKNRKSMKYVTVMLAAITLLVWVVIFIIKFIISAVHGEGFDFSSLISGISDNLLAVLPALLIFNFAYEYFTKTFVSDEMSEQLTKTMMSNPAVINQFNNKAKKDFVFATLGSILEKEKGEVVYNIIKPYIDMEFNLRSNFLYNIIIKNCDKRFKQLNHDLYYCIEEKLSYTKIITQKAESFLKSKVGFFVEDTELDLNLKSQEYFFRENFHICSEDLNLLLSLSPAEKINFVKNEMLLKLYLNKTEILISDVKIDLNGIEICYEEYKMHKKEIDFEIHFVMPQLKSKNVFLVSLPEPTYRPIVQFIYPPEELKVTAIPFLNGNYNSRDAAHFDGIREVVIDDWVFPMSGIMFNWEQL